MVTPLAFGSHKRTAIVPQPVTRLKRLVREALEDAWAPAFGADLSGLPQVLQQLAGQPLHDGVMTKLIRYGAKALCGVHNQKAYARRMAEDYSLSAAAAGKQLRQLR